MFSIFSNKSIEFFAIVEFSEDYVVPLSRKRFYSESNSLSFNEYSSYRLYRSVNISI